MGIYVDWKRISEGERKAVAEIKSAREAPICPACGEDMELCVNEYKDEYLANYLCTHCHDWLTASSKSRIIQIAAENAYKKAVGINDAVRHYFLSTRRAAC